MKKKLSILIICLLFFSSQAAAQFRTPPHFIKFVREILLKELSAAPSEKAHYGTLYVLTDGKLYFKNDSGTAIDMTATSTYEAVTTATPSEAFTVDWTANHNHQVTITGAALDITFTNPPGPCRLTLMIIQGDGDDTIDWTHEADILWPGRDRLRHRSRPGAGDVDLLSIWWNGSFYTGIANYDID